jgi:hypothetical protein
MELGSASCDMLGSCAGISSFDIIFILSQGQYTAICFRINIMNSYLSNSKISIKSSISFLIHIIKCVKIMYV